MELDYLNDLFEELNPEDCLAIEGSGIPNTSGTNDVVTVVGGTIAIVGLAVVAGAAVSLYCPRCNIWFAAKNTGNGNVYSEYCPNCNQLVSGYGSSGC